jgi:putative acetyltransferase
LKIRPSLESDAANIALVHKHAFGGDKGIQIAALVHDLLGDKTATPRLSLVAVEDDKIIGHIIFTRAQIHPKNEQISIKILAPLAIIPSAQGKGIGRKLIEEGLALLRESDVGLVFVLGHPSYYPRAGFQPAGILEFEAPYPIPAEHADAWMVQELKFGIIGKLKGKIQCSEVLNRPEHWRE